MIECLYVLYDAQCGLCSRVRLWMTDQPAYCAIDFIPAGSDLARRLFPELDTQENPSELIVVTDEGDVYRDDAAWTVCLWAMVEYRVWSQRIARGPLRGLARKVWAMVSSNRIEISRTLALRSDKEIASRLENEPAAACEVHWNQ
ncbi:MAG TPA: DCC1-like thiol-disulfide oxidoreductase family protein [Thermoanaerobaculia bacterium]|nr:DCC1-like thiol-disulfide oxidoreductase family protein [Thermoanaerobaculia bacterium]